MIPLLIGTFISVTPPTLQFPVEPNKYQVIEILQPAQNIQFTRPGVELQPASVQSFSEDLKHLEGIK